MLPKQQAKEGLTLLKEALGGYVAAHPEGVTNIQVAVDLELESDFEGNQKNYLSWSLLGVLINEGRIRYEMRGRSRVYFAAPPQ